MSTGSRPGRPRASKWSPVPSAARVKAMVADASNRANRTIGSDGPIGLGSGRRPLSGRASVAARPRRAGPGRPLAPSSARSTAASGPARRRRGVTAPGRRRRAGSCRSGCRGWRPAGPGTPASTAGSSSSGRTWPTRAPPRSSTEHHTTTTSPARSSPATSSGRSSTPPRRRRQVAAGSMSGTPTKRMARPRSWPSCEHARDVGQRRQALVGHDECGAVGRQMGAAGDRDGPPQPGRAGREGVDLAVESPRVDHVGPGEAALHHLHQGRGAGDRRSGQGRRARRPSRGVGHGSQVGDAGPLVELPHDLVGRPGGSHPQHRLGP